VAVSGTSGLVPAAALSAAYGIQVVYSRKYKENSHGSEVEGAHYLRESPYVIIDDFISSGATIKRIIGNLEVTQLDRYKKPVAIILYSPVAHEAEFEGIPIINLEVR
jgi:orotate phosphoribosyltransferase-like protein